MKKKIILSSILIVTILTVSLVLNLIPKKKILDTKEIKNSGNMLSMMIEQEDGTYQEAKETSWPPEGYVFNAKRSKCEQGSKLSWDDEAKQVQVTANKSDKCYLYFDVATLAKVCEGKSTECLTENANLEPILYYHDGLPDYDGMLNYKKEVGDLSYRFSGSNTDVKNYVCLDSRTTGACKTDDDLYRIIGLFKNKQDEYEMKLIKASAGTTTQLGNNETAEGGAYSSGTSYYWNKSNGTDSGNVNMWAESNLNKVNLNTFYSNYITTRATYLQGHITEHTWTTGGYRASSSGDAKAIYDAELGEGKVKVGDEVCYTQENEYTTRACTAEDLEYKAHIGLFYISDYMYATIPSNWTTVASSSNIGNNNWLKTGSYEWSISRYSSYGRGSQYVSNPGNVNTTVVYGKYEVRPSFYLTSDAKIKEGEGSKTKPYRITF